MAEFLGGRLGGPEDIKLASQIARYNNAHMYITRQPFHKINGKL